MTRFATTAEIQAVNDSSAFNYAFRYAAFYIAAIALSFVLQVFKLTSTNPTFFAVMVAYLCTRPSTKPRFRALSRFAVAVVLSAILSLLSWLVYRYLGKTESTSAAWVFAAVFYTVIFGNIESLSYWWTCLVTPGRSPETKNER
tara:strand:+ start:263 stop:694 length:432 start_codon:yes stop_codon:yes gene_type:complete